MPFQNLAQFLLMTPYIITLEQRRGCTTKFNNEEVVQVPSYYTWYNFRLSRKIIGEPSATPIFDLLLHNLGLVTPPSMMLLKEMSLYFDYLVDIPWNLAELRITYLPVK